MKTGSVIRIHELDGTADCRRRCAIADCEPLTADPGHGRIRSEVNHRRSAGLQHHRRARDAEGTGNSPRLTCCMRSQAMNSNVQYFGRFFRRVMAQASKKVIVTVDRIRAYQESSRQG